MEIYYDEGSICLLFYNSGDGLVNGDVWHTSSQDAVQHSGVGPMETLITIE